MYQPNRIGPHAIHDPDTYPPNWPTEWDQNLDASAHEYNEKYPQLRDGTVVEVFQEVVWSCPATTSLAANKAHSWGVALNGEDLSNLMPLLTVASAISSPLTGQVTLETWIGRTEAPTVSAARTKANKVFSWFPLGCAAGGAHCWKGSLVLQDSALDGYGTNPLIAGVTLYNGASTKVDLPGLQVALSFHRFTSQLEVFDPKR